MDGITMIGCVNTHPGFSPCFTVQLGAHAFGLFHDLDFVMLTL